MNKYYTPDISEFYVGFEYESLQDERLPDEDSSWAKITIETPRELREFLDYYIHDSIAQLKVKYLDQKEIESLGFKQGKLPYQFFFNTYMLVDLGNNKYSISQPYLYDDTEFRGIIKNKSELRKLLEQLNVK